MSKETQGPSLAKTLKNFALGGISGMVATCFVQPIDMVKVRIQILAGENPSVSYGPLAVTKEILKNEGLASFYKG
jgi:solute carrier family 25 oxoglutarate transporter 11